MLKEFIPEIVIIATNGPSHFALAKNAILHGVKKMLITKPLTCTLQDANELRNLATLHHVKVAVDHGLRYDDTYNWIFNQIQENIWGELLSINIMRNGIGLGCLGTHSFDLANFLFDSIPENVTAWVDSSYTRNPRGEQFVDPGGLVILDYSHGKKAIISQLEKASGPMIVQLHFEFARLVVDVKYGILELVTKTNPALPIPNNPERIINPQSYSVSHDTIPLMERILENLISDKPMKADALHGMRSVEILMASYKSSEHGHLPVTLPITDEAYLTKFLPVT
jgi:predicted dehydrogenase